MPRLFTGLEIPPQVAQSLAMMRGGLPGARWIDPENYHLTLRFIGDIDDGLARDIASLLGGVQRAPFELRLDGLSSFGGRKPRALVAAAVPVAPLMDLHAEHERLLQRLGLEPEGRKYTPHVTLARLRDSSSRHRNHPGGGCGAGKVGKTQLMGAMLLSAGAELGVTVTSWPEM